MGGFGGGYIMDEEGQMKFADALRYVSYAVGWSLDNSAHVVGRFFLEFGSHSLAL
jgi:hypothetical protein